MPFEETLPLARKREIMALPDHKELRCKVMGTNISFEATIGGQPPFATSW